MRYATWKKATTAPGLNTPRARDFNRKSSLGLNHGGSPPWIRFASTAKGSRQPVAFKSPYASISEAQRQKKRLDRDFFVSVLETSATKRDTKGYMNKFVPVLERKGATGFKQRPSQTHETNKVLVPEGTVVEGVKNDLDAEGKTAGTSRPKLEQDVTIQESLYVALIKFRAPQQVDDATLNGVGKTLGQLRKLGLISIVVVDCGRSRGNEAAKRQTAGMQANRIAMAIDKYDARGARVIDSPIAIGDPSDKIPSPFTSQSVFIGNSTDLMSALKEELIPIIPSFGFTADTCTIKPVSANEAVLALTRQLSGLQFLGQSAEDSRMAPLLKAAEVYRLIILDPLGGTPAKNRATGRHLFLNIEQEFQEVKEQLTAASWTTNSDSTENMLHLENAELAKDVLSLLPPTSSAVITTPQEVATERGPEDRNMDWALVGTRRGQNPLIHSLLTDKPVHSSSLPSERFRPVTSATGTSQIGSLTTLAKRGMPLTIFPDPRVKPWQPPQPGQNSLGLTDPCIDLPRLVHLIEDSFGRKLDVEHYLGRIAGNLAGIIIAGEYEGGALLTWERPAGTGDGDGEGGNPARLVPYLDKFAVLRKSQGAGGVADIIFNAMVRDCFPYGVCWRSRKDNPVNKWYFERSRGSLKFADMNWTMFWTTPELALDGQRFRDYESVCRGVEPSWADKKKVAD